MAKDYAKIKALAASILECIGDDDEGENPKIPGPPVKPDPKPSDFGEEVGQEGGQSTNLDFLGDEEPVGGKDADAGDEGYQYKQKSKKKSKDASLAMYAASLSSKFTPNN